jgi:hypothetical protein
MSTPRRELSSRLYHAALRRPSAERTSFLKSACRRDCALQQEVQSLLRNDPQRDSSSVHHPRFWDMGVYHLPRW